MRTAVRSVAFVLLAMALVGLVVLLTPSLPTLPDASGAVAAGGDGAPSSLRGGLAAAPVATDERTNERTSAPASAAGASPTVAAAPQTQWLRVVDGITRAPLPNATIHFEDRRVDYQQLPEAEVLASWDDPEVFARKHGQTVHSDGAGRVEVQFHGFCRAHGRLGERFGEVEFGGGLAPAADPQFPGEVVLPLFADHTLRLRLVDDGGRPVPGLVVRGEVVGDAGQVELARPIERTSDENGRVVFLHLQQLLQVRAGAAVDARTLTVEVTCLGGGGPRRTFDAAALPSDEVELRVPSCGELRIAVQQADGSPWSYPGLVLLDVEVQPLALAAVGAGYRADAGTMAADGAQGRARGDAGAGASGSTPLSPALAGTARDANSAATASAGVAANATTAATATHAQPSLAATSHEFVPPGPIVVRGVPIGMRFRIGGDNDILVPSECDGPRYAGERVDVAVRLRDDLCVVCGRLLDAERQPFVGTARLTFDSETGTGGVPLLRDDAGYFTALLDDVGEQPQLAVRELDFRRSSPRTARITLDGPLQPGRNDLGDVVMTAGPLLVAGRLELPEGLDVARAALQVVLERSPPPRFTYWSDQRTPHVVLDAQHAFAVHQHHDGHRWRLRVRGDCVPVPPIPFEPGARDLVIPITKPATLTATFVPDPLLAQLELRLLPRSPANTPPGMHERGLLPEPHSPREERTAATWRRLAGGPYRLVASVPGAESLWQLDVDVPAGGVADDPRLLGVDLRGLARLVRLTLRDADGAPFVDDVSVVVPERQLVLPSQRGPTVLVAATTPTDVWLLPRGRRAVRVPAPHGDTTVELARAVPFTVAWPGIAALPTGVFAYLRWSVVDAPMLAARVQRFGDERARDGDELLGLMELPRGFEDGRAVGVANVVGPVQAILVLGRDAPGVPDREVRTATVVDPATLAADAVVPLLPDAGELAKALQRL